MLPHQSDKLFSHITHFNTLTCLSSVIWKVYFAFLVYFLFICDISEYNVDLLREMGGVVFIYNLSKSSVVHSDVKETALFTVCALAEANG